MNSLRGHLKLAFLFFRNQPTNIHSIIHLDFHVYWCVYRSLCVCCWRGFWAGVLLSDAGEEHRCEALGLGRLTVRSRGKSNKPLSYTHTHTHIYILREPLTARRRMLIGFGGGSSGKMQSPKSGRPTANRVHTHTTTHLLTNTRKENLYISRDMPIHTCFTKDIQGV